MKRLVSVAALFTLLSVFAITAIAQKPKSRDELIKEIVTLSNTKKPEDSEKAYQLGKEFLTRFGSEKNDKGEVIGKIRDFVNRYREGQFFTKLDAKDYSGAFPIGKEILAEQPDNVEITMNLAYGGYMALAAGTDKSLSDDAVTYARKTLQMMEAGSVPKNFAPFKDKDDARAWMYYIDGSITAPKDMKSAASTFYKATTFENSIKNSSQPYIVIAYYFEDVYEKLAADYKVKAASKTLTAEALKVESDRMDKAMDLMMDAYARALKYGEAENNPSKGQWKDRLTVIYKFRKKTEAGLPEYINSVSTTQIADPGKF